ncbi:MAG TPA: hypothetical protein VJG30_04895 [Candidatus Nanoarchaeia archaeon]|nr:hypothetical protein [Candidatus Nanoarchaeia archaeon]
MVNEAGDLHLTTGFILRLTATAIIVLSLPFLVSNPSNVIAQVIFAFGNFLLVIGANVR